MYVIPHSWSHLHILISVFPSFGLLFVLGFYIAGLRTGNEGIKRTCLFLFGVLALLGIPIYLSGDGSMTALSLNPRFPRGPMNTHYIWGLATFGALGLTGVIAWVELLRSWTEGHTSKFPLFLVLALAAVALGLAVYTDELGWAMNHRELQTTIMIENVSTSPIWPHAHLILNHKSE